MSWIIYKHTCPEGKVYIGQTCQDTEIRWGKNGINYIKYDTKFARAILEYGWNNFSHEIIEKNIETIEEANQREIYWINYYDSYHNGYNSTLGGSGLIEGKHIYKIDMKSLEPICEYISIKAASREYGGTKEAGIRACLNREAYSSCGFFGVMLTNTIITGSLFLNHNFLQVMKELYIKFQKII